MNLILILLYGMTIIYGLNSAGHINNKKNNMFWLWCALILCLLTITSDSYADLYNYENYYDDVTVKHWSITYRAMPIMWGRLCLLFGKLHMTYRGMFCCVLIISSYFTHLFAKKLNCSENTFWSLFLIFPGLIHAVQLRFFLGSSLAMYGSSFILTETVSKKENIKKYFVFVVYLLLGTLIHSACIFIGVLFLTEKFKKINVSKLVMITIGVVFALMISLPIMPSVLSLFLDPFYIQRYFTSSTSKTTWIRFLKIVLVWVSNVALAYFTIVSNKKLLINDRYGEPRERGIVSKCFAGICIFAVSLPLLAFDENFHRFFEMGYILLYIIFSKLYMRKNIRNLDNRRWLLGMLLVSLLYCIYVYYPLETIVFPLFRFEGFKSVIR